MATSRRRAPIRRGKKKELLWTATLLGSAPVLTTPQEFLLAEPAEWERSSLAFEKGATLERIRGWLSFGIDESSATNNGTLFAVIWLADIDDAAFNGTNVVTYTTEDVLWTGGHSFQDDGANVGAWNTQRYIDLDVKARRKLTSQKEVRISFTSTSVNVAFIVSGLVRTLVSV